MKYITETDLRIELRNKSVTEYYVAESTKLTPAAVTFLNERKIPILIQEDGGYIVTAAYPPPKNAGGSGVILPADGNMPRQKPERKTHLFGDHLVDKTHPRIYFRGKMDCFIGDTCLFQTRLGENDSWLIGALEEAVELSRKIIVHEVTGKELETACICRMEPERLRTLSHDPKKYFHIGHLKINYELGWVVCGLNSLRTGIREAELAACVAFNEPEPREDIIFTLNRMSSYFYVLMLMCAAGKRDFPEIH